MTRPSDHGIERTLGLPHWHYALGDIDTELLLAPRLDTDAIPALLEELGPPVRVDLVLTPGAASACVLRYATIDEVGLHAWSPAAFAALWHGETDAVTAAAPWREAALRLWCGISPGRLAAYSANGTRIALHARNTALLRATTA